MLTTIVRYENNSELADDDEDLSIIRENISFSLTRHLAHY